MIQRVQSVWLFLAAMCGYVFTQLPLAVATLADNAVRRFFPNESLLLFALSIATALLAFVSIFLFKNRKLQFKLTSAGILLSVVIIALEVWQAEQFKAANTNLLKSTYSWGSLFPIAMLIFFILAASGIRKDEKLIKSLDRLR